jgi:DNA polymerase III subunit delta'
MALKDIIGQEKAIGMLLGIMNRQRIASSYLFSGEPGIGKKATAINFAKALNCQNTVANYKSQAAGKTLIQEHPEPGTRNSELFAPVDACDECNSCMKIPEGTHPDVLLLTPEERQIRVEEIRMIDGALAFKPFEGRKKVVIVDEAETMNIAAANAFLKTLEEPPEESVIILVSSRPDLLLPTIRSRCSRINFSPLSSDACKSVLKGKVPEDNLDVIAGLSMGRPGLALSTDLIEERNWFFNLLDSMLNAEKDGWASREDMEQWLDSSFAFLRDMMVLKVTGNSDALISPDRREYTAKLNKSVGLKVIINIYGELNRLKSLMLYNLNKSITWNYIASLLRKELSAQNV